MPTKSTTKKAKRALAQGKQPSTAAGEFVREEIEHVRKGKHGARSARQAIAIGLAKARRAGVPLKSPPPPRAERGPRRPGRQAVSRQALARQARSAASRRTAADRSRSAKQAAATRRRRQHA
jgi:hypothetical protein